MNKIVKRQRIFVPAETFGEIQSLHGCSRAALYNALAFRTNSPLAKELRREAMERGGVRARVPVVAD